MKDISSEFKKLGVESVSVENKKPAEPGFFDLRIDSSTKASLVAAGKRESISALSWLKARLAAGYDMRDCTGRRQHAFGEFVCFTRRWKPVQKQCIDMFEMSNSDIRTISELGGTALLNGWCEGIAVYFNELVHRTHVFPDIISPQLRDRLAGIWQARRDAAESNGLDMWSIARAPFGPDGRTLPADLTTDTVFKEFGAAHPEVFGVSRANQIPSPMCLSNERVRAFYGEAYRQAVTSTPSLKGMLFWPGDSNMDFCCCPKCMERTGDPSGAMADFINMVIEACRDVRKDIRFYLIHWHCVSNLEGFRRVLSLLPADVGILIPKTGHCMGTDRDFDPAESPHDAFGMNQPFLLKRGWSAATKQLVGMANELDRDFMLFDSFATGEDTNPVPFFPAPATTALKVRGISDMRVQEFASKPAAGVVDFWGLDPRRMEACEIALQESMWRPDRPEEDPLTATAARIASDTTPATGKPFVDAWNALDSAMQNLWKVVSFGQRLENCFVGWRDETFPPAPPAHEHEGFSAPPVAGDLLAPVLESSRFKRAERRLNAGKRDTLDFLKTSQTAAANALSAARRHILEHAGDNMTPQLERHLEHLHNAQVHFDTFARNFLALEIIDSAAQGSVTAEQTARELSDIAVSEVTAWKSVMEFVEKHGFQEAYWTNELNRRIEIQNQWTDEERWLEFLTGVFPHTSEKRRKRNREGELTAKSAKNTEKEARILKLSSSLGS